MHELLLSVSRVADDGPQLVGVHLIRRHQVDKAFGILGPFRDPVPVFHAIKIAHGSNSSVATECSLTVEVRRRR